MEDYIKTFEEYKDIKEISDLINEVNELREYFYSKQYDKMHEHIKKLTYKYAVESLEWNAVHTKMPTSDEQSYINAEQFLHTKGIEILIKNGIKYQ